MKKVYCIVYTVVEVINCPRNTPKINLFENMKMYKSLWEIIFCRIYFCSLGGRPNVIDIDIDNFIHSRHV